MEQQTTNLLRVIMMVIALVCCVATSNSTENSVSSPSPRQSLLKEFLAKVGNSTASNNTRDGTVIHSLIPNLSNNHCEENYVYDDTRKKCMPKFNSAL